MLRLILACATAVLIGGCATAERAGGGGSLRGDGEAPFRGGTMRYDDTGPLSDAGAPAVVLVHGWSSGREFWHKNAAVIGAERRVIALDLPGHGESDEVAATHSMDLYADAIAAVLDDAGVERAVLVGHSNGTPTVRQFLRRRPERTAGLVAVDGALRRVFPSEMAAPMLAAFEGQGYREAAERMFGPMSAAMTDPRDAEMVLDRMRTTPQRTMIGGLRAGIDDAIWTDDRVGVPLLVINAPNPMFWTPEYEARVREMGDDVEYHTLDGVSHFLMMDDPEAFNATLIAWLDRQGW